MFTCEGLSYPDALKLIEAFKEKEIEANITCGGVSVHVSPDQINEAKEIATSFGASFSAGYSAHQEDILIRSGCMDHLEQVTNNAIALIQEWK